MKVRGKEVLMNIGNSGNVGNSKASYGTEWTESWKNIMPKRSSEFPDEREIKQIVEKCVKELEKDKKIKILGGLKERNPEQFRLVLIRLIHRDKKSRKIAYKAINELMLEQEKNEFRVQLRNYEATNKSTNKTK